MITREFLDEVLPNKEVALRHAEALSGLPLSEPNFNVLRAGLEWMARMTESDRFWGLNDCNRPQWKKENPFESVWPISMRGLEYKDSSHCLTVEGWPTGTKCWYVCIESGRREFIGAEKPELAVLRAIVVICVAIRIRNIAPKERPDLMDALRELVVAKAA